MIINPYVFSSLDNSLNTNGSNQQMWMIIGDSTALGNTPQDSEFSAAQTYSSILNQWNFNVAAIQSVGGDLFNSTSGSPWVNFGMNYYYRTGYKICFIPAAVAGSRFTGTGSGNSWSTRFATSLYDNLNSYVVNGNSALGVTNLRGIIVGLGVNDAGDATVITDVYTDIDSLVTRLQADRPGVPIYFISPGKTASGVTTRLTQIRTYIEGLPARYDRVYVVAKLSDAVVDDTMYDNDGIHYSQFLNEMLGAFAIKNMAANGLIANSPPTLTYPTAVNNVIGRLSSPPTTFQRYINDFVKYMDDNSLWSLVDSFYCTNLNSEANSLQDWVRGTKQAVNHGTTWDGKWGFRGNGSSAYVDMNFIATTDGVNYTLNSCTLSAFIFKRRGLGDLIAAIGSNTNHRNMIFDNGTTSSAFAHSGTVMNDTGVTLKSFSNFFSKRLLSSGTTATQFARNGSSRATGTSTSVAMPPVTFTALCRNTNGTLNAFMDADLGPVMMGSKDCGVTNVYRKIRQLAANCMAENA